MHCTEAEDVAISEAEKKTLWMTNYLEELGKKQHEKILYRDSQNVIQLVRNPVYHLNIKHRRRYHFTSRLVKDGNVFGEDSGCMLEY